MAVKHNIFKHLLVETNRLELYRPIGPEKEQYWKMTATHIEKARRIMHGEDATKVKYPQPPQQQAGKNGGEAPPPGGGHDESPPRVPPAVAESPPRRPDSHGEP